jgi:hypothetical protein
LHDCIVAALETGMRKDETAQYLHELNERVPLTLFKSGR